MKATHEFYSWDGVPVRIEWFDGPVDVSSITQPADHPTGQVPDGERHAMVELIHGGRPSGWWASEDAVLTHAEPIGPVAGRQSVGIE